MFLSLLKKLISVFLVLTHFLQNLLWAFPENPTTFHVKLKENSVRDFSLHVKIDNSDFSFSDSSTCYSENLQLPWQRSVTNKQATYAFNDHAFFKVDYLDPNNKRLILLGNLSDVNLDIESDCEVVLSPIDKTTRFNGIRIQTSEDINNYGHLKVGSFGFKGICHRLLNSSAFITCEEFFSCTTNQKEIFNNVNGFLSARTIDIGTGSLLNEKATLIASGTFSSTVKRNKCLQLITSGIHLTAKRLIDHRYGTMICGTDMSTIPSFGFSQLEYEQKRFGLDARSGTIIAKNLSLYDNAWPYYLDNAVFYIIQCASVQAKEINSSDAPFALLAKDISVVTRLFLGNPYLYAQSAMVQIPYHSNTPDLNFGEKTKIDVGHLTLKGIDPFEPKGLLKGVLKVQLLTLEMHIDTSDLILDISGVDLRHKQGHLHDKKLNDKKINEAYVKISDVETFNEHQSLKRLYIFPKSKTGSVTFHDLFLKNGIIHLVDEYDGKDLFLSGNVKAKEVSVHSKKNVRDDGKIGTIDEVLSVCAHSLSITSSSIILARGVLDVQSLMLTTLCSPARIQRDLTGVDLSIEGAGAIFEEPVSFRTLVTKAHTLALLGTVEGKEVDIDVETFVIHGHSTEQKQERASLDLERDSKIKFEEGQIVDADVTVKAGTLNVSIGKKCTLQPGFSVSKDRKNRDVVPSKLQEKMA